jgi:acyl carrier protein
MAEIDREIMELVAKVIKRDVSQIDPNVNIFKEYHVDSLLGVEILASLDKKYGLNVPEEKIRQVKTLNDLVQLTKEQIAKKG